MTFPSDIGGPTTQQVGFFACDASTLAGWIRDGVGGQVRDVPWSSWGDAGPDLAFSALLTRRACVPVGDWALVLTNGPTGTDVGVLPIHAARDLGVRAVRAVLANDKPYPARILEVFGPEGEPPLRCERSIAAANDGGKWVFETSGTPHEFEDQAAYRHRSTSSRFTGDMLLSYLRALEVPVDAEPEWRRALLVESRR